MEVSDEFHYPPVLVPGKKDSRDQLNKRPSGILGLSLDRGVKRENAATAWYRASVVQDLFSRITELFHFTNNNNNSIQFFIIYVLCQQL
jgi:hypothetical protein